MPSYVDRLRTLSDPQSSQRPPPELDDYSEGLDLDLGSGSRTLEARTRFPVADGTVVVVNWFEEMRWRLVER